jgi:hypothetical protein
VAARTVGLLHPGEMGAAVGAALLAAGHRVVWASEGRSEATRARADQAGLEDAGTLAEVARSEVVLSVCPPHAAVEVAGSVGRSAGIFVDANAIAPATAFRVGELVEDFVDGGIVGPPPREPGTTRLYLSGRRAGEVAELFAGSPLEPRVVENASGVKMAYAAWTKGSSALLLAVRELARAEQVEPTLLAEWELSLPELLERSEGAARSAEAKGWRWVGEMEEIAATFEANGLPGGFHHAAAEVFRR